LHQFIFFHHFLSLFSISELIHSHFSILLIGEEPSLYQSFSLFIFPLLLIISLFEELIFHNNQLIIGIIQYLPYNDFLSFLFILILQVLSSPPLLFSLILPI